MIRPKLLFLGAATFLAAHAVEVAGWRDWFYGVYAPWFLNSGRAVAMTAGALVAVAAIVALTIPDRREWLVAGLSLAAGAAIAMAVVLFAVGPGTLFPIAIVVGAAVIAVSSAAGAFAGAAVRYTRSRSPRA
jgi:uncharacterized membrane protein